MDRVNTNCTQTFLMSAWFLIIFITPTPYVMRSYDDEISQIYHKVQNRFFLFSSFWIPNEAIAVLQWRLFFCVYNCSTGTSTPIITHVW